MGITTINGVPAHVLFIHAVVVLVPLSSVCLVACALFPFVMRRFGVVLPLLTAVTLVSVPFTTSAGEWLEQRVAPTDLVNRHTGLGDELLPWVVCLFVLSVPLWWIYSRPSGTSAVESPVGASRFRGARFDTPRSNALLLRLGGGGAGAAAVPTPVRVAAVVLTAVVAAGAIVQVYRIGDSGAKAAWQGRTMGVVDHRIAATHSPAGPADLRGPAAVGGLRSYG
ncbi:hypothetical protein [Streptomyces sp. NPDC088725]|uniref:hypothetical protein n=1 Tax=Streptomyces sp. NPDC088725 TaxID=3365873 RepID=UPI003803B770